MMDADPMNPQRVVHELSQVLPEDAIITADSGSSTNWYARQLKLRRGNLASLSGTLATMVPGVPYAIAAKFAHPGRPVICFVGDGAFQMLGMNEMLTVKRYHGTLARQAAHLLRLQQPGPEPGDLGTARDGGRPEVPRHAVAAELRLRRLRRALRPEGDLLRRRRPDGLGVGGGARRRPPGRARGQDRPRDPAAAAAHPARAGRGDGEGDGQGRPRAHGRDGEVPARKLVEFTEHRSLSDRAAPVERLEVHAYTIPTDEPESDGTLEWDSTTIVVVEAHADERTGLGYTYCDAAAAEVVSSQLAGVVEGEDAMDVRAAWLRMCAQLRNAGQPGIGFCAVSAVDLALWDLKARLLEVPLVVLLGAARDDVPVYGSGGFCSYSEERLCEQLGGWAEAGIPRVKMKVGREPERDPVRLDAAREAIGDDVELFVDANGAFARRRHSRGPSATRTRGT